MSEIYSTVFIWWITQFANVITDLSASITSRLSFPRHVHLPKNSGSNKCDWKSRSVMEECRGDPKSYERIYSPPPSAFFFIHFTVLQYSPTHFCCLIYFLSFSAHLRIPSTGGPLWIFIMFVWYCCHCFLTFHSCSLLLFLVSCQIGNLSVLFLILSRTQYKEKEGGKKEKKIVHIVMILIRF